MQLKNGKPLNRLNAGRAAIHQAIAPVFVGSHRCAAASLTGLLVLLTLNCLADDWPQWLGPKRDSVWRETGIIEKFSSNGVTVLWRRPIGGGYSGPSVANGR